MLLGLLGRHARDALEGGDLFAVGPGEVLAGLVELALAVEELAVALLEHVAALVELLVALEQAALEAGQLGAPGARLFLGLALHAQLLVLGLEDQLLLAGACLGLDPARFGGRRLHRLRCPHAAQEDAEDGTADGGHDGHRQDEHGFHILFLPSGRALGRRIVLLWAARSPAEGPVAVGEVGPSLGRDRAGAVMRAAEAARGSSAA